jgi:dTDP-4-dehydrorhamnose reductase
MMPVRFAVVGSRGMFGSEMANLLRSEGYEVTGFDRGSLNLEEPVAELSKKFRGFDVVINAVAYTAVDRAESEPELANKINGEYAGKLAQATGMAGARFVHISTDYVFDGNSVTPYTTTDSPNPQGAYGQSKLLGEKLVKSSGSEFTIFRTAWLYGRNGRCFPKVMQERVANNEFLRVVNDQFGQPTWTRDLAMQVLEYSKLSQSPEIVHAVSTGKASWFDFAKEIVGDYEVAPVSSMEFVTAARRPKFSVLDNSSALVEPIGDWRDRWQIAKPDVLQIS